MLVFKQDKEFEKKLKIKTEKAKLIRYSSKIREEIKKEKDKVVILGGDDKVNRSVVENKNVILLNPELNKKQDSMHYRKSGLNQVLCKLANKNNVAVGFNFSLLLNTNGKERGKLLGRMFFNYKMCKKYKVNMIFSTFANDKYELRNNDCIKTFERVVNKYSKNI